MSVPRDSPHVDDLIAQDLRSHGMRVRRANESILATRFGVKIVISQFVADPDGGALNRSIAIDGPCVSFTKKQDDEILGQADSTLMRNFTGKPGEVIGP